MNVHSTIRYSLALHKSFFHQPEKFPKLPEVFGFLEGPVCSSALANTFFLKTQQQWCVKQPTSLCPKSEAESIDFETTSMMSLTII